MAAQAPHKRTRQLVVLAGIGTLVVVGLGFGLWQMLQSSGDGEEGSLQAMTSDALAVAAEASELLRENVSRDAGRLAELWRESVGDEEEPEETEEEAEVAAAPTAVEPAPSRPPAARKAPPVLAPVPTVRNGSSVIATRPALPPLPGIFDESMPGVVPPGTENIRLHNVEPLGVPQPEGLAELEELRSQGTSLVEVIVSPYGDVERAKLISAPGDIHEAMILSAIKAWQFTPAIKDGHPVRYRLVLPVDVALGGKVMPLRADAP